MVRREFARVVGEEGEEALALKPLGRESPRRRRGETHVDEKGRGHAGQQCPLHFQCVGDQSRKPRAVLHGELGGFVGVKTGSRVWNTVLFGPGRGLFCPWHLVSLSRMRISDGQSLAKRN